MMALAMRCISTEGHRSMKNPMTGLRATHSALVAALAVLFLLAACRDEVALPQPPSVLIPHDEDPFGSQLHRRIVNSMSKSLDYLEPDWGRFSVVGEAFFTITPEDRRNLPEVLSREMPEGWEPLDLSGERIFGWDRHELHAYRSGKFLYAVVITDPGESGLTPVRIYINRPLERAYARQK